jgi:hypothetical protein
MATPLKSATEYFPVIPTAGIKPVAAIQVVKYRRPGSDFTVYAATQGDGPIALGATAQGALDALVRGEVFYDDQALTRRVERVLALESWAK